jgi:peroxidase
MKIVVTGLLLAAAICAAATMPMPLILDNDTFSSSPDFHQASCPQLPGLVRFSVQQALRQDMQVTAGLLRIFFHDCLPQGCDASIFLDDERRFGPNGSLQARAEQLVEDIRVRVHRACGPTVSCARHPRARHPRCRQSGIFLPLLVQSPACARCLVMHEKYKDK